MTPSTGSAQPSFDHGPLADLVVLDFTIALAGPFATRLLAAMGATVIKIEAPVGESDPARRNAPFAGRDGVHLEQRHDDDISLAVLERGRGKQAITLDLKHPEASAVVADLAARADLAVQNWSPGVAERLGVDHGSLSVHNPAIVVCAITGFGLEPATGGRKAMDTIIQAMSGLMMTAGHPEDPPILNGVPLADLGTPLFALVGALAAVHQAKATGVGQLVDVSMLGAITSLVAAEPYGAYRRLGLPTRPGNTVQRLAPFGTFPTSDGHVAICAPTDRMATALLEAIGGPDLAVDGRFGTRDARVADHESLHDLVRQWTAGRSTPEVLEHLDRLGVPAAPVRTPDEAVNDPLLMARGEVEPLIHPDHGEIDGVVGSGLPMVFSGSAPVRGARSPGVGEHNELVYGELLGYTPARLAELIDAGVI